MSRQDVPARKARPHAGAALLTLTAALAGLLLAALLGGGSGCERTPMDVRVPNQRPQVAISAGPIRDSTNVFIATFNWNASDPDGEVEFFRYAVDDTAAAEDWFETDTFEITVLFTAPDSARVDSVFIGASQVPLERYVFNGAHTFFLKAVDDQGAESPPAALSFTAETIAPETDILAPLAGGIVTLGSTFTITWEGTDIDGTEPPVAYSWRLVRAPGSVVLMSDREIEEVLLDPGSNGEPWSPFEPRQSVRLRNLASPDQFLFGVRAVDQAGAIEPHMRTFRAPGLTNVLLIRVEEEGSTPALEISSSVKTTRYPTADERKKTFEIPAATNVLFTWVADASRYGGTVTGYSYGIDLDDLEENNPDWAPESANLTQVRLHFTLPEGATAEEHLLFVRVRDDVGTTLIADVALIVVPLSFERDVIMVDDWGRDDRGRVYPSIGPDCATVSNGGTVPDEKAIPSGDIPQDGCHDAYLRDSIALALDHLGHPEWVVDRYEVLEPVDGSPLFSRVDVDSVSHDYWVLTGRVTLARLARYKLVIWNTRSFPGNYLKKMNTESEDNFLAVYLEAGGAVWITGTGVFYRTLFGTNNVPGLRPYGFESEDFPYRFLKVRSVFEGVTCVDGCFRQSGASSRNQRENGFEAARLAPAGAAEGFPALRIARAPIAGNPVKGVGNCDAMVVPLGLDINPRLQVFGGRLDTLYFYQSNWSTEVFPPGRSWMDDAACALRYSGPDQGRLMMFGFPFFYFPEQQMDPLLTAGLRWLLAE